MAKLSLFVGSGDLTMFARGWLWAVAVKNVYNHGHNIMKMFDVLPNFPFTTTETKPNY